MTSVARPQLTLNFEPALPEQFKSLRAYIAFRVQEQRLNAANLAGKMDLSPSVLSRKLNQPEGDTQRFNCDDLEAYVAATGDISSVMEYLAAKYMDSQDARRARVLSSVESMLPQFMSLVASLKESAA